MTEFGNDATWLEEFDKRTQECAEAKAQVLGEPTPRIWPISGAAEEWNPDGHPLSYKGEKEAFSSCELDDQRTQDLNRGTHTKKSTTSKY